MKELDIKNIIELRKQGKYLREIAEEVNYSIPTIRKILKKHLPNYKEYNRNVISKRKINKIIELREKGKTIEFIANSLNIGVSTTHKILKDHLKTPKISLDTITKILTLKEEGKDEKIIAVSLDLTVSQVKKILSKVLNIIKT